ncbi:MAG: ATP-dependent helicase [Spirochaetia bacterium]|nr:ATP-dependent helicase [Spirochaetia bacterium]
MADLDKWLDDLNPAQKEAVLEMEHPLLVLAGAGSGKTRVITTKIAYCVERCGIKPWQILAVTFTNKAAGEMRNRVGQMLPDYDTNDFFIKTFHSFGVWLLRLHGDTIGLDHGFSIYDDADSLAVLSRAFPNERKKDLAPIMKLISKLKDIGLGPDDDLSSYSHMYEIKRYYRGYEDMLRNTGNVDFGDLIKLSIKVLDQSVDARNHVWNRFKVVLVDEYQDSNIAQFQLLRRLAGPDTRVCVVGDDDQSIYRFRGAEVRNILSFPEHYPGTRTVKLEQNYRSTDAILKLASCVIKHNKERYDKTLRTDRKGGEKPVLHIVSDETEEARQVADILMKDGKFDGSAVLYRTNAQSVPFETLFTRMGIPHKVVGALKFYDREEVKDVISLLYLFENSRDVVSFSRMINKPPRGIGNMTQEKILSLSEEFNGDVIASLKAACDRDLISARAKANALGFLDMMLKAYDMISADSLVNAAIYLIEQSGLKDFYQSKDLADKTDKVSNLDQLVNALSNYDSSEDGLLSFLEEVSLDHTKIGHDDPSEKPGVTLITMHNTKGLEFDRVFMVGLEENLFPGYGCETGSDDEAEERRIFYVASTRARSELHLFTAQSRKVWGHTEYGRLPSRFLSEIDKGLYEIVEKKTDRFSGYAGLSRLEEKRKWNGGSSYRSDYRSGTRKHSNLVTTGFSSKPRTFTYQQPEREDAAGSDFEVGDRVYSDRNGKGWIRKIDGSGDHMVLFVVYDTGKTAKYRAQFAMLEKIAKD